MSKGFVKELRLESGEECMVDCQDCRANGKACNLHMSALGVQF